MMMRIHKTGANDLIGTINHFDITGPLNTLSKLRNLPIFDQNIGFGGNDVVIRIMYERDTVREEDITRSHFFLSCADLKIRLPSVILICSGTPDPQQSELYLFLVSSATGTQYHSCRWNQAGKVLYARFSHSFYHGNLEIKPVSPNQIGKVKTVLKGDNEACFIHTSRQIQSRARASQEAEQCRAFGRRRKHEASFSAPH